MPKRTAAAHIVDRLRRCRSAMAQLDVRALLVTRPMDCFYLTGFTGEDSAVLVLPDKAHLLTDRRFETEARREAPWAKAWMRRGTLNQEVAKACQALRIKSLAVQPEGLTVAAAAELSKLCRPTKLTRAADVVGALRKIKDAEDLRCMKRAIVVAEEAFTVTRKKIRTGMTELELAALLEYEMKRRGALRPAFPSIIAEGPNAALPHASPGSRKVREGSAILFDWGARVGLYCSDLTRMVFVGTVSPRFRSVYEAVLAAQMRGIEAVRPAARMCDVDAVARQSIKKAGFGKRFSHGLGHGLGLDVHEAPSVSWRSDEAMQPGMVVTVEPGIYISGFGGVRIEDDVLVTSSGGRVLTHLGKRIEDALLRG
ncbi:MAG: aminopeptidase P family protein [Phycisphaerales bacterium]|nr:aminopeptidase P family protein [Phycisphaerales bacterium]